MHGGGAPQVKAKAIERLMALQHPALDRIAKLIAQDEYPSVAYSASKDVLDRTIGRAVEHVELTHHAADEILARLAGARDRTK